MSGARETRATKDAPAPFDGRCGADVKFRTSDNVDFHLHKSILSLASTHFENMFTDSQPSPGATSNSASPNKPVEISEDSLTFDLLLRYSYPIPDPDIEDLNVLDSVLSAATKYQFDTTVKLLVRALRSFVATHTLQVYTISCRHDFEDEAGLAAETWKKTRATWPHIAEAFQKTRAALCYVPEMAFLRAGAYFRLIQFIAEDEAMISKFCHPPSVGRALFHEADSPCFPFDQPSVDLVLRSIDNVDFRVHRLMVEMQIVANPTFPLQAILLAPSIEGPTADGLPVVLTNDTSHVLRQLLKLCYPAAPGGTVSTWSSQQCFDATNIGAIAAAQRYGLLSLVDLYRDRILSFGSGSLESYCVCVSFGWHAQAKAIASNMSYASDSCLYHETLEMLTAA